MPSSCTAFQPVEEKKSLMRWLTESKALWLRRRQTVCTSKKAFCHGFLAIANVLFLKYPPHLQTSRVVLILISQKKSFGQSKYFPGSSNLWKISFRLINFEHSRTTTLLCSSQNVLASPLSNFLLLLRSLVSLLEFCSLLFSRHVKLLAECNVAQICDNLCLRCTFFSRWFSKTIFMYSKKRKSWYRYR